MATYQSGLLNDYFRRSGQRRALTGFGPTYQEQRGLLDPMLAYDAQKTSEAGLLRQRTSEFDRQMSLREKELNNQETAALVGGVGQIAQLPLAYGAAKSAGIIPKSFELLKPGTWGGATTTAQGMVAPAVGSTTAQGMTLGGAAYPGIAGGTAAAGAVGPGSAVVAEGAGAGLLGTAGAAALPAAAGSFAGRLLGKPVSKLLGTHEKTTSDVMGVAGGAAVGFAVAGPVGAVIGAGFGLLSSLF